MLVLHQQLESYLLYVYWHLETDLEVSVVVVDLS